MLSVDQSFADKKIDDPPVADGQPIPPPISGEEWFLANLGQIESLIERASTRLRLCPQDAEDFASMVKVRLIDKDYEVLRRFRGLSQWSTFLSSVIDNLGHDFLCGKRGKWRSSQKADDLGADAIELERLYCRDGFTLNEAVELMRRNHHTSRSRHELLDLASQLPARASRQTLGEEHLAQLATPGGDALRIEALERASILAKVERGLTRALRRLAADDLEILRYQYRDGLTLTEIAAVLGLRRRRVYTRRARCLRRLRRLIEGEGLSWQELEKILDQREARIKLDFERCEARLV